MNHDHELVRLARKITDDGGNYSTVDIGDGEVEMFRYTSGEIVISAKLPNAATQVGVMKINASGKVVGCSPGLVEWALERVRRYMVLECLADV
jgi:hypothetical protein